MLRQQETGKEKREGGGGDVSRLRAMGSTFPVLRYYYTTTLYHRALCSSTVPSAFPPLAAASLCALLQTLPLALPSERPPCAVEKREEEGPRARVHSGESMEKRAAEGEDSLPCLHALIRLPFGASENIELGSRPPTHSFATPLLQERKTWTGLQHIDRAAGSTCSSV